MKNINSLLDSGNLFKLVNIIDLFDYKDEVDQKQQNIMSSSFTEKVVSSI